MAKSDQSQTRGESGLSSPFPGVSWELVHKTCRECGAGYDTPKVINRDYCYDCANRHAADEEQRAAANARQYIESQYRGLVRRACIPPIWQSVRFESSKPHIHSQAFSLAKDYAMNFNRQAPTLVFSSRSYGTGKTHLAACIANHVLHELRRPVLFKKARDLMLELRRTYSDQCADSEADVLNRVLGVELLVLDDVGIDVPSQWLENTYWTVFDRRMEWGLPVIVTTNYRLEEPDANQPSLGERIGYGALSRLLHMCGGRDVDLSGPDLR